MKHDPGLVAMECVTLLFVFENTAVVISVLIAVVVTIVIIGCFLNRRPLAGCKEAGKSWPTRQRVYLKFETFSPIIFLLCNSSGIKMAERNMEHVHSKSFKFMEKLFLCLWECSGDSFFIIGFFFFFCSRKMAVISTM